MLKDHAAAAILYTRVCQKIRFCVREIQGKNMDFFTKMGNRYDLLALILLSLMSKQGLQVKELGLMVQLYRIWGHLRSWLPNFTWLDLKRLIILLYYECILRLKNDWLLSIRECWVFFYCIFISFSRESWEGLYVHNMKYCPIKLTLEWMCGCEKRKKTW